MWKSVIWQRGEARAGVAGPVRCDEEAGTAVGWNEGRMGKNDELGGCALATGLTTG